MTTKTFRNIRSKLCFCSYCWTFGWLRYCHIEDLKSFEKSTELYKKNLINHGDIMKQYRRVCKKCAERLLENERNDNTSKKRN